MMSEFGRGEGADYPDDVTGDEFEDLDTPAPLDRISAVDRTDGGRDVDDGQLDEQTEFAHDTPVARRFILTGPGRDQADVERRYLNWMHIMRSTAWFPGEVARTPEEDEAIKRLNTAYEIVGNEAEIDMSGRRTDPRHCHVFPSVDAYLRGVVPRYGRYLEVSSGMSRPELGIAWSRRADPAQNTSLIGHEMAHEKSAARVEVRVIDDSCDPPLLDLDARYGYAHLSSVHPHGVTEWVADMTSHKAMRIAGFSEIHLDYTTMDLIGSVAVEETAKWHGAEPFEVENWLIGGMFGNYEKGITAIREYLGDHRMEAFVNARANMSLREAEKFARRLDIPRAVDALRGFRRHKRFNVFQWRRPS